MFKKLITVFSIMLVAVLGSQGANYELDPAHTEVAFKIRHMGLSKVRGQFLEYTGSIAYDGKPASLQAQAEIKVASVDTGNEKRDAHLLNKDFFNEPEHALMTFKSTGTSQKKDQWFLDGDMTIKGVTKPVSLAVELNGPIDSPFEKGKKLIGLTLTGDLKRHAFGVSNDSASDKAIGKVVYLEISLEAKH